MRNNPEGKGDHDLDKGEAARGAGRFAALESVEKRRWLHEQDVGRRDEGVHLRLLRIHRAAVLGPLQLDGAGHRKVGLGAIDGGEIAGQHLADGARPLVQIVECHILRAAARRARERARRRRGVRIGRGRAADDVAAR